MTPDATAPGPPPDPKAGRFTPLAGALRRVLMAVAVLAALGAFLPGAAGRAAAWAAIAVLMATPLARVAWLGRRWFRRGDPRFGWVAVGVLAVVMVAALLG